MRGSPLRAVLIVLGVLFGLHLIGSFTHEEYGRMTSLSNLSSKFKSLSSHPPPPPPGASGNDAPPPPAAEDPNKPPPPPNEQVYSERRANATFLILCRNNQLWDALRSVREIEDRFNHIYHYPYVFLNEVEFTEEFKYRLSSIISSTAEFGLIPHDHWFQPDWIDETKATENRNKMVADNIIYGVWSNFEIANMEFWRGPAYTDFFEYLESQGGFYYERWGDAPVHSIAAALFASKDQIQFFDEI
ncbi:hypothetical protein CVT24_009909, partial [Panaeolus cyanescens]